MACKLDSLCGKDYCCIECPELAECKTVCDEIDSYEYAEKCENYYSPNTKRTVYACVVYFIGEDEPAMLEDVVGVTIKDCFLKVFFLDGSENGYALSTVESYIKTKLND